MNHIQITVDHETLTATLDRPLVARSVGIVEFTADFDPSWDGYTKTMIFTRGGCNASLPCKVLLDGPGPYQVPPEALDRWGDLYISAVGVSPGKRNPTAKMAQPLDIGRSGETCADEELGSSPALWEQALNQINTAAGAAQESAKLAEQSAKLAQSVKDDADAGKFNGKDGDPAQLLSTETVYQASPSNEAPPTGAWTAAIPQVPQGQYLWSRATQRYNTGDPVVVYSYALSGVDGAAAELVSSETVYQAGSSGKTPPTGTWTDTIPNVPQGGWLWTKVTYVFNTGEPVVSIWPAYQGRDGTGAVDSVNGKTGAVTLGASDVGALPITGGKMTGDLGMGGHALTGIPTPQSQADAANMGYVDNKIDSKIANNLATTEPGFALDARMGKALSDRHPGKYVYVGDLNGKYLYSCLVIKSVYFPEKTIDINIDLSDELPANAEIIHLVGATLNQYALPYVTDGVTLTWCKHVYGTILKFDNNTSAWDDYVLYSTLVISVPNKLEG